MLISFLLKVLACGFPRGLFPTAGCAATREPTVANLEVEIVKAARSRAPNGYSLVDIDIYGESEDFRPHDWPPIVVHPATADVMEGRSKSIHLKPVTVIDEWFHNEQQSNSLSVTFVHKTSHTTEIQSRSLDMVRIGTSVSVEASVPLVLTGAISFKTHIDMKKDSASTIKTTEDLSVNEIITVPPRTSTHVTWHISEHKVEVPWTAEVHVTGVILATYRNTRGQHRQSFGIGELDIMPDVTVAVNRSHAYFLMDGAFIVTKGISGETIAEDFDLKTDTHYMG